MSDKGSRIFSIGLVSLWLGLFAFASTSIVLVMSFLSKGENDTILWHFTLANYKQLFNPIYITIFFRSLLMAGAATLLCLLIAYPFAFCITRTKKTMKPWLLVLLIIPFWTSSLIRSYAIMALLKTHGLVNQFLFWLGIIHQPLDLLFTNTAVMIGLVYNLLPFMVFPIYANLEKLDHRLIIAARDLGANHLQLFFRIMLPLSIPGIMAGIMLVFLPAMTLFFIPDILGGAKSMMLGNLIQFQFLTQFDWPQGAATSVMLTLLLGLFIWFQQLLKRQNGDGQIK